MRIAIDARELEGSPTGAGRFLREVLRHWPAEERGRHEILLYFKKCVPDLSGLSGLGMRTVLLRPFFLPVWDVLWEQVFLPGALLFHRADVFWGANGACPFFVPRRLKKVVSVYDLTFFRSNGWYSRKERFVRRWRLRVSAHSADSFLTVSQASVSDIRSMFPGMNGHVRLAYPGVEHLGGSPKSSPSKESARVLFVGSILNRRPVENLIRAVALLAEKYPTLRLRVVGENRTRPLVDLRGVVRSMGLEKNVEWLGYVDEDSLWRLYGDSDVFCYPSLWEGFGIPLIEAQAAGLPVVTLKNSALAEVGGDSVLYAESERPADLASSLERLMKDRALYERLREKGFENARRFSWVASAGTVFKTLTAV